MAPIPGSNLPSDTMDGRGSTSTTFDALSGVLLTWYCIYWSISLVGLREAFSRYKSKSDSFSTPPPSSSSLPSLPGVSILRPLKGLDPNLYENLLSSFVQEYPKDKFEIIFSVADEDDQALVVVRELIKKFTDVQTRIVIGADASIPNPKIANLISPLSLSKYNVIWVLDSGISISRHTLLEAVQALTSNDSEGGSTRVGLVHQVPFGVGTELDWGSRLERAFLNTNHARMYMAINKLKVDSCVMGKSNLYLKSDLVKLTGTRTPHPPNYNGPPLGVASGLEAYGKFLAEDNMIGLGIWHELQLSHRLLQTPALNALGPMSLRGYVSRRMRWIRVRKRMTLAATLVEPLTESLVLGICFTLSLHRFFPSVPILAIFLLHYSAWFAADCAVCLSLATNAGQARVLASVGGLLNFTLAWIGREVLAFPIWLMAVLGDQIEWRGKKYRVLNNGEAEAVEERSKAISNSWWPWSWMQKNPKLPGSSSSRGSGYQALNQHEH